MEKVSKMVWNSRFIIGTLPLLLRVLLLFRKQRLLNGKTIFLYQPWQVNILSDWYQKTQSGRRTALLITNRESEMQPEASDGSLWVVTDADNGKLIRISKE
ncbi:MAG: hypothetical protein R2822_13275 [Spirosomataceae bacterium]